MGNGSYQDILVIGATSIVGEPLCSRLASSGANLTQLSRSAKVENGDIVGDLSDPATVQPTGKFDTLIHLAPLWVLPDNLERFAGVGVTRVIAFSSTSAITKRHSEQNHDREIAQALNTAEEKCRQSAHVLGLDLTVLRPTMIYGFGKDKNITIIARTIRRLGFFPLAGRGSGLRQPVHALDLVDGTIRCLDSDITKGKTYNLGGGESLSYKHMVERIFSALGVKPRVLHLPVTVYKALLRTALSLGVAADVSPAAANRMNEDLYFDCTPARRDFGYHGSRFLINPTQDLPL